jgi:hypothetical protein
VEKYSEYWHLTFNNILYYVCCDFYPFIKAAESCNAVSTRVGILKQNTKSGNSSIPQFEPSNGEFIDTLFISEKFLITDLPHS